MEEKRIDGELVRKLEKGELDERRAKMLLEKERIGLGLFAWENRDFLAQDPRSFVIETAPDIDIKELERKYQAKFLRGEVRDGAMYCLMKEWGDINIEVNVWNCQAEVIFRNDDGNLIDFECNEEIKAKLDKLAYNSVYDAGGWINMSGIYPPNSELIEFFRDSLANGSIKIKS